MMRELKFRAWDKRKKEMTLHDSFHEVQMWNRNQVELSYYEIMQYTGLKDRNGKEIYEGDFLTEDHDFLDGFVKWWNDSGQWALCNKDGYVSDSDYAYEPSEWYKMEIIGNIYENPDLLNGRT